MRKPVLRKYPKKPKASASIAAKENYLNRIHAIDRENAQKISVYKKSAALSVRIAGIKHTKYKIIAPYTRKKTVAVHERRVKGLPKKRRTTKRKTARRRR